MKKPQVYPLKYAQNSFASFDEVSAYISPAAAEDISESTSRTLDDFFGYDLV